METLPVKQKCETDPSKAAEVCLLKLGGRKRLFVRTFEIALAPIVWLCSLFSNKSKAVNLAAARTILVIEYWNVGDIVILLPFLQGLRTACPHARITLLMNPSVKPLLENQNVVDEIRPFRTPWSRHFSRWKKYNPLSSAWTDLVKDLFLLRRNQFDLGFTGRMDVRDNFLLWLIGPSRRIGYGVGGGGLFLTDVVHPDLSRPHRAEVWQHLLTLLGVPMRDPLPQLWLSESETRFADRFLADRDIRDDDLVIGIHPGARIMTRRWGDKNFEKVAIQLQVEFRIKLFWFTEPSDQHSTAPESSTCVRVALPFRQFLAVLSRCRLLICNDTGPMHLATAFGVPVVAVFGPQEPRWFGPMGKRNRVVIRPEFWCRPCSDYCVFDQPYCLRTISPDDVLSSARAAIRHEEEMQQLTGQNE